jgi:hypothetical protein
MISCETNSEESKLQWPWYRKRPRMGIKNKLRGLSPRANYTDRPTDRHLLAKLVPAFAVRGCHVVSMTDP